MSCEGVSDIWDIVISRSSVMFCMNSQGASPANTGPALSSAGAGYVQQIYSLTTLLSYTPSPPTPPPTG